MPVLEEVGQWLTVGDGVRVGVLVGQREEVVDTVPELHAVVLEDREGVTEEEADRVLVTVSVPLVEGQWDAEEHPEEEVDTEGDREPLALEVEVLLTVEHPELEVDTVLVGETHVVGDRVGDTVEVTDLG